MDEYHYWFNGIGQKWSYPTFQEFISNRKKSYVLHDSEWLEVDVSDIEKMDIVDDISDYSFVDGRRVYLNSDDSRVFLEKKGKTMMHVIKHGDEIPPVSRWGLRRYNPSHIKKILNRSD